jgi:predicted helicase
MNPINNYYRKIEELKNYSSNESSIRRAFENLLDSCATERKLSLIAELPYDKNNIPDGTLKDQFRFDIGYWEAKDENDNLDDEIDKKLAKGYPNSNIIFEDSKRAVLIQNGNTVLDIEMEKEDRLKELLETFLDYEKPEIAEFRKALEQFTEDIPKIVKGIKEKISVAEKDNKNFNSCYSDFREVCENSIDKNISKSDIYEMLIQHILTEDIFRVIFSESEFHIHNNIAVTLNKLENSLFTRNEKKNLFNGIRYYYEAIKSHSKALSDYREKQSFLNALYENFYKAYNPKRADKLGIVYTPLEIVDFMIHSVDKILYKSFGKYLQSENVKILDPSTGTGTYLTQIMNYLPKKDLIRKYENELFANELSILPYYIANLNLEYIYQQKTNEYREFENIAFVDTLELTKNRIGQGAFSFSDENLERIEIQEDTDFTVIIGNPPYNANQQNENDNNKNKSYEYIDKRIKDTYVKNSTAQKTKVYDMYSRFYRWATDRIQKKGVVAFVTNSSFIDSKTFDGFRKTAVDEFTEIYIVDLGGNVRKNPKLSGTKNNVFGIQTGVAIAIFVKRETSSAGKIHYLNPFEELEIREEKLKWLKENREKFDDLEWEVITPDKKENWLNQTDNDWDELLPMGTKETKLGKDENAIFRLFSLGVVTNRDEWMYDFSKENLEKKVNYFIDEYNDFVKKWKHSSKDIDVDNFVHQSSIKWSQANKRTLKSEKTISFDSSLFFTSLYRPFVLKNIYYTNDTSHSLNQQPQIFPEKDSENLAIGVMGQATEKPFSVLGNKIIPDLNSISPASGGNMSFPLYTFKDGVKTENITDFGFQKFVEKYGKLNKVDIFHYIYAVLHFPKYREKYETNLKQDLPRIPFYNDFWKFANVGKELLDLHVNFENVSEFEIDFGKVDHKLFKSKKFLDFFPEEAFEYKLGNRSAIEWVIDGYKEKKIKDPTVAKLFDNYKFENYREDVLSLLKKVTTVSLETQKLIKELE